MTNPGDNDFLRGLRSPTTGRYKRYTASPIRYAGGKSRAVGYIIEHIPTDVGRVVSPFIGGGSVEIALANEMGVDVDAYDIFGCLTTYWQVQIEMPDVLADRLAGWHPTKPNYAAVKERLRDHWQRVNPLLDMLDIATHYWINHNLSYGPGFLGWMSKIYEDKARYNRMVQKVRGFKAPRLTVSEGHFGDVIPAARGDFLYLDPPYFLSHDPDNKMFRGIYPQRNFPVHHDMFEHQRLRSLLYEHDGGVCALL